MEESAEIAGPSCDSVSSGERHQRRLAAALLLDGRNPARERPRRLDGALRRLRGVADAQLVGATAIDVERLARHEDDAVAEGLALDVARADVRRQPTPEIEAA